METSAVCRRSVVEFSAGNGAPQEIRIPDPQIRSPTGSKSAAHVPGFQIRGRVNAVRIARNVSENGAPERIRTADPQIRSLGSTIEIIEVRSHKRAGLRPFSWL